MELMRAYIFEIVLKLFYAFCCPSVVYLLLLNKGEVVIGYFV